MADEKKSCGNCLNCDKVNVGKPDEFWCCETYGLFHFGVPANVTPPHDKPCERYSETKRFDVGKQLVKWGF